MPELRQGICYSGHAATFIVVVFLEVGYMSKLLVRQLAMLRLTPRQPRSISTRHMMEALQNEGFEVSHRTVQRDMKGLAQVFPGLETDGNRDEARWFWRREAEVTNVPGLDPQMALGFKLVQTFLADKVPPAVLGTLAPYFRCADAVLDQVDDPSIGRWSDKIRMLPRTQPLIPAHIRSAVLEVVHQALFKERQFRGRYQRRDGDVAEYEFHPLGLVFRDAVVYLVATVWDYEDPRHYALHRFLRCELLEDSCGKLKEFDLEDYVRSGTFEYADPEAPDIVLEALFTRDAARHLYETPLSTDQKLEETDAEHVRVTATVKDSQQLRWWLLGFGDNVKVINPSHMVEEFMEISNKQAALYNNAT